MVSTGCNFMTNGDKIRRMSDEELANILFNPCVDVMGKNLQECDCKTEEQCEACILKWLGKVAEVC